MSSATYFVGVVFQAVVVALIASAIGVAAGIGLDLALPPGGSIPFSAGANRLITSTIYLVSWAGCASYMVRTSVRAEYSITH